jgi:Ca-activated chloride channel family protein
MPLRPWFLSLVCLLCPFAVAHGQAYEAPDADRSLSPYFVVEGADAVFTLEATHVEAKVDGVIADVKVEQTYYNQSLTPIHAHYVFPASERAAVHGMRIRVGDKAVVAKLRERKQAEREFEAAQASGKTASLLAQERPNVFSMSVANILPGDHVVVELQYNELLVPEAGVYQFVYPTVEPRWQAYRSSTNEAQAGSATQHT